jgi:hypothetical protein
MDAAESKGEEWVDPIQHRFCVERGAPVFFLPRAQFEQPLLSEGGYLGL